MTTLFGQKGGDFDIFANFDCKPSAGELKPSGSDPGRFVADKLRLGGQLKGQFPRVERPPTTTSSGGCG